MASEVIHAIGDIRRSGLFPIFQRALLLLAGIFSWAWSTFSLRRGTASWRLPFWTDIRKSEAPLLFFLSIVLGYLLGAVALFAALAVSNAATLGAK